MAIPSHLRLLINSNYAPKKGLKRRSRPYSTYYYDSAKPVNNEAYAMVGRASTPKGATTAAVEKMQDGLYKRADTYDSHGLLIREVTMRYGVITVKSTGFK